MEVRRHDSASTPWPERTIITLYWAVSGYGLRIARALAILGVVVVAAAVTAAHDGFADGPRTRIT